MAAEAGVDAQSWVVEMRGQACEKRAVASLPTVVVFWELIIRRVAVALQRPTAAGVATLSGSVLCSHPQIARDRLQAPKHQRLGA